MPLHRKYIIVLLLLLQGIALYPQSVYKTPAGSNYHLASCHMVKNVSDEITIVHAQELGLQPCKICKAPLVYNAAVSTHKAKGQDKAIQCNGRTKAGIRCRHMTSIGNGYCYQHQP